MSLRYPIEFGRHLLLERVNVGGMAEIFKAKAFGVEGFERIVAVKRILPALAQDEEFVTMFVDEARIAAHLTHQNIVQIYELGKEAGTFFISMEYVAGKDLRQVLDDAKAPLAIPRACHIVACIAEALDYAHQKRDAAGKDLRIIHRDVTPQNVILSYEGEVKLCDFGIAKAATRASRTQVGVLKGKFAYMSPEQVRGQPTDRRSDLFALGVVFYEMVTGKRLFLAETDYGTLEAVRTTLIPPPRRANPAISESLEAILMKLLAREPRDRYQWASELHDDLAEHVIEDGRAYHARHLRAWMRTQYEGDIAAENAKLEAFMRMTVSGVEDTSTDEAEDQELAGPPSVVLALDAERAALAHDLKESGLEIKGPHAGDKGSDTDPVSTLPDTHAGVVAADDEEVEPTLFDLAVPDFSAFRGERALPKPEALDPGRSSGAVSPAQILRRLDAANLPDDSRETLDASVDIPAMPGVVPRVFELGDDTPADDERATQSNERVEAPIELVEQPTNITDAFGAEEDTRESAVVFDPPRPGIELRAAGGGRPGLAGREGLEGDADIERVEALERYDALERMDHHAPPERFEKVEAWAHPNLSEPAPEPRAKSLSRVRSKLSLGALVGDPRMNIAVASIVGVFAIGLLFALLLARSTKATLQVVAEPEGPVQVYLDGMLVGEGTPVNIDDLALGLHVIELHRGGFKPYVQSVQIQENKPHTMVVPLELQDYDSDEVPPMDIREVPPAPAATAPAGANPEIDAASKVSAKGERSEKPDRVDTAERNDKTDPNDKTEDRRSKSGPVSPPGNSTRSSEETASSARKAAKGSGFLVVATRPPGVSVAIDGTPTGSRTPIRTPIPLRAGAHVISFELSNGRRYDFDFEIQAGETTRLLKQLR